MVLQHVRANMEDTGKASFALAASARANGTQPSQGLEWGIENGELYSGEVQSTVRVSYELHHGDEEGDG